MDCNAVGENQREEQRYLLAATCDSVGMMLPGRIRDALSVEGDCTECESCAFADKYRL